MVTIVESVDKEGFNDRLKESLEMHMEYVQKMEKKLSTSSDFNFLGENLDPRKSKQSLERLSAVELESIRKELTRQRDTMSRRIERHSEINHRMEKEREHIFKQIQEEGKMLIKKCNILRKHGLILQYRIGAKEKVAKELNNELEAEALKLGDSQMMQMQEAAQEPQRKRDLPYIEYREKNPLRLPPIVQDSETKDLTPGQFVYKMMKKTEQRAAENKIKLQEIEKLAEKARAGGLEVDEYLVVYFYSRTECITLKTNLLAKKFLPGKPHPGVWGLGFGVWGLGFGV